MKLGAWTVTIENADGLSLEEYAVEIKENEITCWIASNEGTATAPFEFKSIVTTDEETLDQSAANDDFGTIKMQIYRGTRGDLIPAPERRELVDGSSAFNELLVKKKRISHICGFGNEIQEVHSKRNFVYLDPRDKRLYTVIFMYRSKSVLQAMEIIPASPAPPSPRQTAVAGSSRLPGNSDIIEVSSGDDSDDEAVRALEVALAKARKDARAAKALRRTSKTEPEDVDVKPKLERRDDGPVPHAAKRAKRESDVIVLSD